MFRAFTCLTEQYGWRLVLLARLVCSLTSFAAAGELSWLGSAFAASRHDTRDIP
jgi:hypothetical protein